MALGAIGTAVLVAVVLLARPTRAATDLRAADVNVACAPSQRALVKQTMDANTPRVYVTCADDPGALATGATFVESGRLVPATYTTAAGRSAATSRVTPARTSRPASLPAASSTIARPDARPSWQKRALIIGGTAGAGAGIGALAGGKKGALIGAAIGAGGATLLDQLKNNR